MVNGPIGQTGQLAVFRVVLEQREGNVVVLARYHIMEDCLAMKMLLIIDLVLHHKNVLVIGLTCLIRDLLQCPDET